MNASGRMIAVLCAALLLAGGLSRTSAAAGPQAAPAKYKIRWLLGHRNLDYFEEAALNFKKAVEEKSRGEISVDIVSGPDSGSEASAREPEIAGKVSKGEAEMGHSFVDAMGALDPRLHAFEDPYLFRGYRHMEGVLEGPVGNELLDGLKSRHIVGLSFTYSGGASGIASTSRPIAKAGDLKGLKVGVFGDAVNAAWLEALGAAPVPIGHGLEAILPKAADGSLDAVVITWRNFEKAGLDKRFKYMSAMNSTYLVSVTYVNEDFFKSLPEAYRKLLTEESRKAGRIERAKTIELNARAKREMLAKDVRSVNMTEDGVRKFVAALRPAYERIERIIGRGLVEKIKAVPDATENPSIPLDLASR